VQITLNARSMPPDMGHPHRKMQARSRAGQQTESKKRRTKRIKEEGNSDGQPGSASDKRHEKGGGKLNGEYRKSQPVKLTGHSMCVMRQKGKNPGMIFLGNGRVLRELARKFKTRVVLGRDSKTLGPYNEVKRLNKRVNPYER